MEFLCSILKIIQNTVWNRQFVALDYISFSKKEEIIVVWNRNNLTCSLYQSIALHWSLSGRQLLGWIVKETRGYLGDTVSCVHQYLWYLPMINQGSIAQFWLFLDQTQHSADLHCLNKLSGHIPPRLLLFYMNNVAVLGNHFAHFFHTLGGHTVGSSQLPIFTSSRECSHQNSNHRYQITYQLKITRSPTSALDFHVTFRQQTPARLVVDSWVSLKNRMWISIRLGYRTLLLYTLRVISSINFPKGDGHPWSIQSSWINKLAKTDGHFMYSVISFVSARG